MIDSKIELLYDEYVKDDIDNENYSLEYSQLKENIKKLAPTIQQSLNENIGQTKRNLMR